MPIEPAPEPQVAPLSSFAGKLDLSTFACSAPAPQDPQNTTAFILPTGRITRSATKRRFSASAPSAEEEAELPASPAAKKPRHKVPAAYAPPSTYAHLNTLPDALGPDLLVLFVGLNPGIQTARSGHAYAHPSNLFWKLLHSSGVTPRRVAPQEDRNMPAEYHLGLTNIVARPSRNGAELSKAEMDAGVAVLEDKARTHRPETMCIVGKSIWESIWRVRHSRAIRKAEFRYGWQEEAENMGATDDWEGARVFVATSTSGLAATMRPAEKEAVWRQLGEWVEKRREERGVAQESRIDLTKA